MEIEFDPDKDTANLAKHGISLARAVDFEATIRIVDDLFEELRYRTFGFLDARLYCVVYTMRGAAVRVISLRRAHRKEVMRHG